MNFLTFRDERRISEIGWHGAGSFRKTASGDQKTLSRLIQDTRRGAGRGPERVRRSRRENPLLDADMRGPDAALTHFRSSALDGANQPCLQKVDLGRPYIWRFTGLSLVIWPSVWPSDQGSVMVLRTASLSLMMPLANDAIRLTLAFAISRIDYGFGTMKASRALKWRVAFRMNGADASDCKFKSTYARLSRAAISDR